MQLSRLPTRAAGVAACIGYLEDFVRFDFSLQRTHWASEQVPTPKCQVLFLSFLLKPFEKDCLLKIPCGSDEDQFLLIKLSGFLSKENHQETLEKETFPAGGSHSLPVSDEEREAVQATGMPGTCCPLSSAVGNQKPCVSAGSSLGACYCTACQRPNVKVLGHWKCSKASQERLSEDVFCLWCVEMIAISVPDMCI